MYFIAICIEGCSTINGIELSEGDVMEIVHGELITVHALNDSHFLFIEMKAS